jgi:hypothetical protein
VKPILVLGPELPGAPSLERGQVDLCRVTPPAEVVAGADYDSVIVINDGGAGTIRRVQMALDMRERGNRLAVGVLTYLAVPALGLEGGDAALANWLALWPQLRVELKEAILSLEYQAD